VQKKNKGWREIIVHMTPPPAQRGRRDAGVTRICRDITHLKKAEERLMLTERLSSLGSSPPGGP